jgi:nucleotide-binding universal stress UspA family protein
VDTSPCAEVASSLAMRLARAFGSHVTLAHVLSNDEPATRDAALKMLERLSNGARHPPKLLLESPSSDIAGRIVEAAQREAADMILIGTHAHARLERKVLGSVAHDVAVLAQIPVMMVPAQIKKLGLEGRWLQATKPVPLIAGATPGSEPKRRARQSQ